MTRVSFAGFPLHLLAVAMFASILGGCGGGGADDSDGAAAAGTDSATTLARSASRGQEVALELNAAAESQAQIDLSWTAGTAAPESARYRVLRDGKEIAVVEQAISYEDVGLRPSTTYAYAVELVDDEGRVRLRSSEVQATSLPADSTPPMVSSVSTEDAEPLPVNSSINMDFTSSMSRSSVNEDSVRVQTQAGVDVPGTVSISGKSATFTPAQELTADTEHTATVTTEASDVAGNAMATEFATTFATAAAADTVAPRVASAYPENGASGVAVNTSFVALFTEAMKNSTLTTANVRLRRTSNGATVAGTVKVSGKTVIFTPSAALAKSAQYTATLSSSIQDAAGNPLVGITWNFTTGASVDATAPQVAASDPAAGKTGVPTNASIKFRFSEPMLNSTLTTASVKVAKPGGSLVAGTVYVTGNYAQFIPAAALTANTQYTATVTTAAKDIAGVAMKANYSSTFRTGASADKTAPTVTSTTPGNGASGVAASAKVSAVFSEALRNITLSPNSFTVVPASGGSAVVGTISINSNIVTFTPLSGLAAGTQYRATITTAAKDSAGNPLAANYSWTFTTAGTGSGGSNTASLEWTAVNAANLSGYRIYYGTSPGAYAQAAGAGLNVGKTTAYTLTGLARGTRYYFAVTAFDSKGNESAYSNEVSKAIP